MILAADIVVSLVKYSSIEKSIKSFLQRKGVNADQLHCRNEPGTSRMDKIYFNPYLASILS